MAASVKLFWGEGGAWERENYSHLLSRVPLRAFLRQATSSLSSSIKLECLMSGIIISAARELGLRLSRLEPTTSHLKLVFKAPWGIIRVIVRRVNLEHSESLSPLELIMSFKLRNLSATEEILKKLRQLLRESTSYTSSPALSLQRRLDDVQVASHIVDPSRLLLTHHLNISRLSTYFYQILLQTLEEML